MSALKDGTRILLHYKTTGYYMGSWLENGDKWEEARWIDGSFEVWAGNEDTRSSDTIDDKRIIGWNYLPEEAE